MKEKRWTNSFGVRSYLGWETTEHDVCLAVLSTSDRRTLRGCKKVVEGENGRY